MKAVINLTIVGLLFNFLHFTNQKPLLNTDCLNYVQKLSNQDKCLASRVDLKLSTARKVQNTNQFYSSIKIIHQNVTAPLTLVAIQCHGLVKHFQDSQLNMMNIKMALDYSYYIKMMCYYIKMMFLLYKIVIYYIKVIFNYIKYIYTI